MTDAISHPPAGPRPAVRRMLPADLAEAGKLTAAAFGRDVTDELAAERWQERMAYPVRTDPDGAFVAEFDGRMVGVVQAIVRGGLWILSMFAVQPGIQGGGTGRVLLERALAYGSETEAGLIVSSNDPRALRLYAACGFELHPTLRAEGLVDRRALPRSQSAIREDDAGRDLESLAALATAIRGAPYTQELRFALGRGGRLLRLADRGFAVIDQDRAPWLLVARDDETARVLLWEALARSEEPTRVRWITGAQQWAIDVVVQARLQLTAYGAMCVRGRPGSLRPFLPSPPFA